MKIFRLFCLLLIAGSAGAQSDPGADESLRTLTSIAEVRELSPGEAGRRFPVEVTGQVVMRGPYSRGLFIYDGQFGIYAALLPPIAVPRESPLGTVFRIRGWTQPGYFLPHIRVTELVKVDEQPIPEALPIDEDDLDDPGLDCQWVSFEGVVVAVGAQETPDTEQVGLTIRFRQREATTYVRLDRTTRADLLTLLHRKVAIRGVAASRVNANRQLVERYFKVPRGNFLTPLEGKASDIVQTIENLLSDDGTAPELAKVRGVVSFSSGQDLYLRGETGSGSLYVRLTERADIERGSVVEVEGRVHPAPFRPMLLATGYVVKKTGAEPRALDLNVARMSFDGFLHRELVTCEAMVLEVTENNRTTVLLCEQEGRLFNAEVTGGDLPDKLAAGAEVRLTGLALLSSAIEQPSHVRELGQDITILLRDAGDIVVLKAAPWWSLRKMLIGLASVAVLTGLVFAWGLSLKNRVARQTALIGDQIQRQAIHNERQRLARELHDTLQQNMTGIALQLEAVGKKLETPEAASRRLSVAQEMLEECRLQGRQAITELRSTHSAGRSLEEFLDRSLAAEAELRGIDLQISTTGKPIALSEVATGHCLEITNEAIRNALRHSGGSEIVVSFHYLKDALEVFVRDDGKGFDTNATSPEGHYGLVGITERAAAIGAEATIHSSADGTSVSLFFRHAVPSLK